MTDWRLSGILVVTLNIGHDFEGLKQHGMVSEAASFRTPQRPQPQHGSTAAKSEIPELLLSLKNL